ncbi:MAG: hypothetical protein ABIK96_17665 [bacterium]
MSGPEWAKIKILLIVLGVIAFVVVTFSLSAWMSRRQEAAAEAFARARGWGFAAQDELGLEARFAPALWGLRNYDLYNIRIVEQGARSIYLCDVRYKFREEAAGRPYSNGVVCLIESDRFTEVKAQLDIIGRGFLEFMISDRVELVDSPYADRYQLQSLDPDGARATATPEVLAALAEYESRATATPAVVSLAPGQAAVLAGSTGGARALDDLVDLALRMERAVP